MPTSASWREAPDVRAIVERLIGERFPALRGADIRCLIRTGGRPRRRGVRSRGLAAGADAAIVVDPERWAVLSEAERAALVSDLVARVAAVLFAQKAPAS